jgi:assimilatory nitrate reductase catalytic subunit
MMELKALVTEAIRPDTLFIPFHYGHAEAVNQLTNPAVDPTVKIPEYKACAARIERIAVPVEAKLASPRENLTPANAPKMFPYAREEGKSPTEEAGKEY